MKRLTVTRRHVLAAAVCVGLLLAAGAAQATSLFYAPIESNPALCTTPINCKSTSVRGTYLWDGSNNTGAVPYVAQVYSAGGGECLRLNVFKEKIDLEMVLISPSGGSSGGKRWRNDDSGGTCFDCPQIQAITDAPGWYTLQISAYNGTTGAGGASTTAVQANFRMHYGRYSGGLAALNCSSPTTPLP